MPNLFQNNRPVVKDKSEGGERERKMNRKERDSELETDKDGENKRVIAKKEE